MFYLYRYYAPRSLLLYAGVTNNLERRNEEHYKEDDWAWESIRLKIATYTTRADVEAAEAEVIRTEHPVYNISGKKPREWPSQEADRHVKAERRLEMGRLTTAELHAVLMLPGDIIAGIMKTHGKLLHKRLIFDWFLDNQVVRPFVGE